MIATHPCTLLLTLACSSAVTATAAVMKKSEKRQTSTCSSYTIINTRGTGEPPGPCPEFLTMNQNILSQLPGGKVYNTNYRAALDQISEYGTDDIISYIRTTLQSQPNECFILQGYSQGASATISALSSLSSSSEDGDGDAVKAVFLVGNPSRQPGLECNVDNFGEGSTRDSRGILGVWGNGKGGIEGGWVERTRDVCISGDGICDSLHGFGLTPQHLSYGSDEATQKLGTEFIISQLQGGGMLP
ncbi:carbohydrate esterase family 5 protein [Sphaerulina musiva SO2202]|uniref:Carbohydrate esterase family 5 protein n=1 Tax=Sphaerulina musiva (strain SO2202) TaxID=692275 RepID=M3D7V2_SPHMS|nr:carbohydrate esterase family 5 protein [Sphaerulina musiva SO2202]EMF13934.1 carbohydrate esterase family 5 protein [Sphaerulina musiva SO2202]